MAKFQFGFYVPKSHIEEVKTAIFDAGAGKIGNYSNCCWQTLGQGQFLPGINSNPSLGSAGELTTVDEYLVILVCDGDIIRDVIDTFLQSHPYEEPAYFISQILSGEDFAK